MDHENRLTSLVEPLVHEMGLELYELALTNRRGHPVLLVQVDRPGKNTPGEGVSLTELVNLNREISALLDIEEPIAGRYRLDVESPGIERQLKRKRHYEYSLGDRVRLVLFDPIESQSVIEGALRTVGDDQVGVEVKDGEMVEVPYTSIKDARTLYDWQAGKKR
ncbi:MAG: hypothetical protein AUK47_24285 [Deltaproteobacteria bacterium CG2_30_63_29]|nr:MAG: hypothetical protein AUK47_24285 [Deltaproteobacteria bacterium CG2_30_63_29]